MPLVCRLAKHASAKVGRTVFGDPLRSIGTPLNSATIDPFGVIHGIHDPRSFAFLSPLGSPLIPIP